MNEHDNDNRTLTRRDLFSLGAGAAAAAVLAPAGRLIGAPVATAYLPDMMDKATVRAIGKGMNYLAKTQRNGGSWLNSGGYGSYPAVMTSLAGLALMAGGSTPESGPHSKHVSRAMNYVLRVAETHKDGLIAGPGGESRSMYGHGFSMLFLAQCYGSELDTDREKRLKKALDKAVKVTVTAQSKVRTKFAKPFHEAGGWYYTPNSNSDEGSVTVTQLQALRACRNAGIKVPQKTINKSIAYLKHCQQGDGGICYSARSRGSSRPAISAAAIACFYAAGVYGEARGRKGAEAGMVEKLVKYVKGHVRPESGGGGHYFYTQYYMAQAMYQRGGKDWKSYFPRIRKRLLAMQAPDGSWMGDSVGTTYGTALACTILQLPYGYLSIYQR